MENRRPVVIPVILDDTPLPSLLPSRLYCDFRQEADRSAGLRKLLRSVEDPQESRSGQRKCILTLGSALVEDFLTVDPDKAPAFSQKSLQLDAKYMVEERRLHFGGSGVNFTVRLSTTGHCVLPIIAVGDDDTGARLQRSVAGVIKKYVRDEQVLSFVEAPDFLCPGLKSSHATVLSVRGGSRTTFTPRLLGLEHYKPYLERRLDEALSLTGMEVSAVMIGHIHSDSPEYARGSLTKMVVDRFADHTQVFANFGITQLQYGVKYWREYLKRVSVVQFSLPEVRAFFATDYPKYSLEQMIEWFMNERISVVITYQHLDVLATCPNGYLEGKVILAEPFPVGEVIDTTGAGDAFASGMVAVLSEKRTIDSDSFCRALDTGRVWGAYACTTFGGSSDSPTRAQIESFRNGGKLHDLEVKPYPEAQRFIRQVDKATSPTQVWSR
jgi:sugar/nucleoside kinase (ribokinase family)